MALPGPVAQASQQTGQQTSATALRDSATNAGDVGQTMKDKMFLRGVVEEGIAQVKFGELAQLRAASEELKAFGKKMVEEHTAVNGEMAPIADSMGVRLPEEMNRESQAEYNKLKDLSGSDFETEYLTVMVKSHHKAMRDFRLEEAGVSDPALRAAVIKGEGTIHEHLMMVNKLARDKGVTMPGRGNRPATPPGA